MTVALLNRRPAETAAQPCPAWCRNDEHPWAADRDVCDVGGGERTHTGRIGSVVLPSRVDEYYDQEIGVELFSGENADGVVDQLSVLLTYSVEYQELGHVCLFDIAEARRLVVFARSDSDGTCRQQERFGPAEESNILIEQPCGHLSARIDMTVEGRRHRLELHPAQLSALADIIASACLLAEAAR